MLYNAQNKVRVVTMVSGSVASRYVGEFLGQRVQPIVDTNMVPVTWEERLFGMTLFGKLPVAINPERRNCEMIQG